MERERAAFLPVMVAVWVLGGCVGGGSADSASNVENSSALPPPASGPGQTQDNSYQSVDISKLAFQKPATVDEILGNPTLITASKKYREYAVDGFEHFQVRFEGGKAVAFQGDLSQGYRTSREALLRFGLSPNDSHKPSVAPMAENWVGKINGLFFKRVGASKWDDELFDAVYAELAIPE